MPDREAADLDQLVRAWIAGEDKASVLDAIFRICLRTARRYFISIGTASRADAEDLVQEALLAAYSGLEKLRNPLLFEAYFYIILHRKLANYFRRHYRRSKTELLVDDSELSAIASRGLGPEDIVYFSEIFTQAAARLTHHQWICFDLLVKGCDTKEIAEWLKIRERTVRVHMYNVRSKLRDLRG